MDLKTESLLAEAQGEVLREEAVINLNAGTCSPSTKGVLRKLIDWQERQARDPVDVLFRQAPKALNAGRAALAQYLGCDASDLLLMTNASFAANTVLRSLPWKRGDELIISDQEYGHNLPLAKHVEDAFGVSVTRVKVPFDGEPDAADAASVANRFERAFNAKTRAIFMSHVTSCTGTVLPVAKVVAAARARGIITIIDGAHGPGLVPVALSALGADFYFANAHKWMMAPASAAFLFVRREARELIKPLMIMDPGPKAGTEYFATSHEYQGTRPLAPFFVLPEVTSFLGRIPRDAATQKSRRLVEVCRAALSELGFTPVTPRSPALSAAMIAFKYPPKFGSVPHDQDKFWQLMREKHRFEIGVPKIEAGTPLLRISCAWFSEASEIEALVRVLRGFLS